jgi:hypothetical protein
MTQHPYTIIIPHYKTKITAYTVFKILEHSKLRDIRIIVVDNSNGEGIEYLKPLEEHLIILTYPPHLMQSHGIAYDFAMSIVRTEWFICLESDSYPTKDGWLDYYDKIIEDGYDGAGSLLWQSGGEYMHPAGALYRKSIWKEAEAYTDSIEYAYFPNMAVKDASGFGYHLMVKVNLMYDFMRNPHKYINLHHSYGDGGMATLVKKLEDYKPVTGVFHNGMGNSQEELGTYGMRDINSEPGQILLDYKDDLIFRVGLEPGQFFHYWQLAMGKKLFYIPTEIKWLPNRVNQQQEYTLTENGVRHEWGVTSYHNCVAEQLNDIISYKASRMNELYESLPKEYKL